MLNYVNYVNYLCSMLFNVDKNMQRLLTLLTKLQGCYIWY